MGYSPPRQSDPNAERAASLRMRKATGRPITSAEQNWLTLYESGQLGSQQQQQSSEPQDGMITTTDPRTGQTVTVPTTAPRSVDPNRPQTPPTYTTGTGFTSGPIQTQVTLDKFAAWNPPEGYIKVDPAHQSPNGTITPGGATDWRGNPVAPGQWGNVTPPGQDAQDWTKTRDELFRQAAGITPTDPKWSQYMSGFTPRSGETRLSQQEQTQRLIDMAEGRGPSLGRATLAGGLQDVQNSALGLAARGDAGGRRAALRTMSDMGRRAAADAGVIDVNQQLGALGALSGHLTGIRTADDAIGTSDADRFRNVTSDNARLTGDMRSDDLRFKSELLGHGLQAQQNDTAAAMTQAQIKDLKDQLQFAYEQLAQAKDQADRDFWGKMITSTIGALGGVATMGLAGGGK